MTQVLVDSELIVHLARYALKEVSPVVQSVQHLVTTSAPALKFDGYLDVIITDIGHHLDNHWSDYERPSEGVSGFGSHPGSSLFNVNHLHLRDEWESLMKRLTEIVEKE